MVHITIGHEEFITSFLVHLDGLNIKYKSEKNYLLFCRIQIYCDLDTVIDVLCDIYKYDNKYDNIFLAEIRLR